jgi:hypothetical protein
LKPPGFNPCAYNVKTWFQIVHFKFNFYRRYNAVLRLTSMAERINYGLAGVAVAVGTGGAGGDETPCMMCGRTDGEESFVLCDGGGLCTSWNSKLELQVGTQLPRSLQAPGFNP